MAEPVVHVHSVREIAFTCEHKANYMQDSRRGEQIYMTYKYDRVDLLKERFVFVFEGVSYLIEDIVSVEIKFVRNTSNVSLVISIPKKNVLRLIDVLEESLWKESEVSLAIKSLAKSLSSLDATYKYRMNVGKAK